MPASRYQLPDAHLFEFQDEILVQCPRCEGRALVRRLGGNAEPPVRLTCGGCGHSAGFDPSTCRAGAPPETPSDPYFRQPLWLRTPCCGEVLWAYNRRHLEFLRDVVQATLREDPPDEHGWRNSGLHNRLPRWIKSARNRAPLLKGLSRLFSRTE